MTARGHAELGRLFEGSRALWVAVRYEEEYVKRDGRWLIHRLRGIGRMAAPYERGWAGGVDPGVFSGA